MADAPVERFLKSWPGLLLIACLVPGQAAAHDIPDERVDRTIRVTLGPGRIEVDYEISLSEFSALLDLRRLEGPEAPGRGSNEVWDRYGNLVGPLNAAGLLLECDGHAVSLESREFSWKVENHLVYSFQYEATLPQSGRVRFRDTNYLSGLGSGRLHIDTAPGVEVTGNSPSHTGDSSKPIWAMSDEEEEATRSFEVDYRSSSRAQAQPVAARPARPSRGTAGISGLDLSTRRAWLFSWVIAVVLGAAHALQPGHGKLVIASATTAGYRGRGKGLALALVVGATHLGSVLATAGLLWASRSARFAELDQGLKAGAGALIAVLGAYRIGRYFSGRLERELGLADPGSREGAGWWLAGIAAGLIPCWDAVLIVLLAEAQGRLRLGIWVLTGFSAGLLLVQLAVAEGSRRVGPALERRGWDGPGRVLGLASGLILAAIGLAMIGR